MKNSVFKFLIKGLLILFVISLFIAYIIMITPPIFALSDITNMDFTPYVSYKTVFYVLLAAYIIIPCYYTILQSPRIKIIINSYNNLHKFNKYYLRFIFLYILFAIFFYYAMKFVLTRPAYIAAWDTVTDSYPLPLIANNLNWVYEPALLDHPFFQNDYLNVSVSAFTFKSRRTVRYLILYQISSEFLGFVPKMGFITITSTFIIAFYFFLTTVVTFYINKYLILNIWRGLFKTENVWEKNRNNLNKFIENLKHKNVLLVNFLIISIYTLYLYLDKIFFFLYLHQYYIYYKNFLKNEIFKFIADKYKNIANYIKNIKDNPIVYASNVIIILFVSITFCHNIIWMTNIISYPYNTNLPLFHVGYLNYLITHILLFALLSFIINNNNTKIQKFTKASLILKIIVWSIIVIVHIYGKQYNIVIESTYYFQNDNWFVENLNFIFTYNKNAVYGQISPGYPYIIVGYFLTYIGLYFLLFIDINYINNNKNYKDYSFIFKIISIICISCLIILTLITGIGKLYLILTIFLNFKFFTTL